MIQYLSRLPIAPQILLSAFLGFCTCTYFLVTEVQSEVTKKIPKTNTWEEITIAYSAGEKSIPSPEQTRLQLLALELEKNRNLQVKIESHAYAEGDARKELLLSEQRSLEVARFLEIHGVRPGQIRRFFYGSARPTEAQDLRLQRVTKILLLR